MKSDRRNTVLYRMMRASRYRTLILVRYAIGFLFSSTAVNGHQSIISDFQQGLNDQHIFFASLWSATDLPKRKRWRMQCERVTASESFDLHRRRVGDFEDKARQQFLEVVRDAPAEQQQ